MKIEQIKNLDIGVSGISCLGEVVYTKDPKNIKGESNGKPYDFWSQFIVVQDDTGDIGVNLSMDNDNGVKNGDTAEITKATLSSYKSNGETKLVLKGRLADTPHPKSPQNKPQSTNGKKEPDWDAIAEGKVRHGVVCAAIQSGQVEAKNEMEIKRWVAFIMNGNTKGFTPDFTEQDNSEDSMLQGDLGEYR